MQSAAKTHTKREQWEPFAADEQHAISCTCRPCCL